MMYRRLTSMINPTLTPTKKVTTCMMTHEQIQQMFSEESDDDKFLGFESILPILVRLVCEFDSWGVYSSKYRCVLYTSVT